MVLAGPRHSAPEKLKGGSRIIWCNMELGQTKVLKLVILHACLLVTWLVAGHARAIDVKCNHVTK